MNRKAFKFITLILTFAVFVCLFPLSVAADDGEIQYYSGLEWDDVETIDSLSTEGAGAPTTTKTSVDLTNKFPSPGNQGNQNSCVGWAVAYLKSSQEAIKRGWTVNNSTHQFSPSFIYNQLNGGDNKPISISSAMALVERSGICSVNYFPYVDGGYGNKPSGTAKAAAELYKIVSYEVVDGVQNIKNSIAANRGVVIGITMYPDFDRINASNPIYDNIIGLPKLMGHAVCLIGYDDSKQAFKFINSWGTGWGLGGYGWISYKLVENPLVNRHKNGNGVCVGYTMVTDDTDDYIMGDVNGDGKISIVDSKLLLNHIAGNTTLTNRQFAIGDVNGDAKISILDSKKILQYVSGTITQMPIYD